jgi:hypothetical protein
MDRIPRGPPQCSSHVSAMPAHVRRCTRLAGVSLANVSPFFVKAASPPYSIVFGGGSPRYAVNRLPVTRDSCAQDQPRDSCAAVTAGADQQNVGALHITSHCQKLAVCVSKDIGGGDQQCSSWRESQYFSGKQSSCRKYVLFTDCIRQDPGAAWSMQRHIRRREIPLTAPCGEYH